MTKFDRYLTSQLLRTFGFFALVLVGVYWINRAVSLFDRLIGDGQSALVFLEFTALTLPSVIRLVLPVAAFAAAVAVANRLASESELVVMRATGFSNFRLARPVLVFGLIVALLMSVLMHFLVPRSRVQLAGRTADIAENVSARILAEGTFQHPADGITVYVRAIDGAGTLGDIFLFDGRSATTTTTYTAKSAVVVQDDAGPKLVMFDGLAETLRQPGNRLFTTSFRDFTYDIGALGGADPTRRGLDELSTPALLRADPATQGETHASRAQMLFEAHNRIAQPFLAPVAALVGFASLLLGRYSRFGLWRQILLAVVLLIAVQLLSNSVEALGTRTDESWPFAYLPVAVGGLLAAVLLRAGQRGTRSRALPA